MICPIMSRPLQHVIDDGSTYHSLGELLEVYCCDDCAWYNKQRGGCKSIDGKE
jgi:hypothetical protein